MCTGFHIYSIDSVSKNSYNVKYHMRIKDSCDKELSV